MACVLRNTFIFAVVFFPFSISSCTNDDKNLYETERNATVVIVPDIQNYTHLEERFKYLNSIADYYHENSNQFDAILQVGDLTNNNQEWQYENAFLQFFSKFSENDQMIFCLGNHDYGTNGKSEVRMSNLPRHMMPSYDIRMEDTKWDNYVKYIKLGGKRYGVLVLEFCTRNETLQWANGVIANDAATPYIILTHVFLDQNGEMFDASNNNIVNKGSSHKKYKMDGEYKNDSREIFDKIIYSNPNVKLVICGHCLTPNHINVHTENNAIGKPIHMIEVNYQHYTEGGLGYVGILDITGDTYRIRSYSTFKGEYGDKDIRFGNSN